MEALGKMTVGAAIFGLCLCGGYLFWRYYWFFRNPARQIPEGEHVLSPADGTVVYVKLVPSQEPVLSIKEKRPVRVSDIVREDLQEKKLLIGVFMSPFDIHYNRSPLSGKIEFVRHHDAVLRNHHMGSMHWRSVLKRCPIYKNSPHIVDNERTVTKIRGTFKGEAAACYVVQIGGGSVNGIESYVSQGSVIEKGQVFGMIRIGSQVDVVITWKPDMEVRVKPGDKVRAGETIFVV
jgi:phosphatidylserine decarboxylase